MYRYLGVYTAKMSTLQVPYFQMGIPPKRPVTLYVAVIIHIAILTPY